MRSRGRIYQASRIAATIATIVPSSGQRVSSTSSLWMFWTVLNPISGSSRTKAMSAVQAVRRSARAISTGAAAGCASSTILDFLHVRAAENALGQEDHGDGEDGEGGDVLVVGGEIGRPHGLDQADQEPAEHGARQRADAAQHRGGECLHAGHET